MTATPCLGSFPYNTKITLTQADKIISTIRALGEYHAIEKCHYHDLSRPEMRAFIERNGLNAPRNAA